MNETLSTSETNDDDEKQKWKERRGRWRGDRDSDKVKHFTYGLEGSSLIWNGKTWWEGRDKERKKNSLELTYGDWNARWSSRLVDSLMASRTWNICAIVEFSQQLVRSSLMPQVSRIPENFPIKFLFYCSETCSNWLRLSFSFAARCLLQPYLIIINCIWFRSMCMAEQDGFVESIWT